METKPPPMTPREQLAELSQKVKEAKAALTLAELDRDQFLLDQFLQIHGFTVGSVIETEYRTMRTSTLRRHVVDKISLRGDLPRPDSMPMLYGRLIRKDGTPAKDTNYINGTFVRVVKQRYEDPQ